MALSRAEKLVRMQFILDKLTPKSTLQGEMDRLLAELILEDAAVDLEALEARITAVEALLAP